MFKRLGNLIKGFFGLFVGGLEKRNPEALLEVEKENLRKQIAKFNQGLATHAGLVEKLVAQVRKLDKEENELRAKTAAHLKAGNRKLAGEFALKLKKVDAEHDDVKVQLEDAEKRYKELIRARDVSVKEARDKIESLKRGIDDMKVQKAMAELNEMAAGMVTDIGGSGDTLSRLDEIVEEERTKAAGRARVAKDSLDMTDISMKESEQDALAEMALADFAAAEGMQIETTDNQAPPSSTEEQTKSSGTMGPGVTE
ncbi:phage shock protein A (PspA) family protein [Rubritalea squalenifaciens DSM 18772]|uniref:Phage shock protein A (PspA) family protein n=2 Tax=Rubritalea TaxID=361050 RepID=A0A1M6DK02_9BACT|nr:PspA/IM30 family protein [Rubritalea squalenifaciens]SHI73500.1 phage shock protein A (PspA) family protein [Rubritalea squalenifaciens DSM 18772]